MLAVILGCVGGLVFLLLVVTLVVVICYRRKRRRADADSRPMFTEDKRHLESGLPQWKSESKVSGVPNGRVPTAKTQHIMEMLDAPALAKKYSKGSLKTKVPVDSAQRNGTIPNRTITPNGTTIIKHDQNKHSIPNGTRNTFPQRNGYILKGDIVVKTGFLRNGIVQNGSVRNEIVPTGSVRKGIVKNGFVPNGIVQNGIVQNGSVRSGIVKTGILHDGFVKHGSIKLKTSSVLTKPANKTTDSNELKGYSVVHKTKQVVDSESEKELVKTRMFGTNKNINTKVPQKQKSPTINIESQDCVVTIPVNMNSEDENQSLLQKQNEVIEQLDEALNEFHNEVFYDETTIVTDILQYDANSAEVSRERNNSHDPGAVTNKKSADSESKQCVSGIISKRSSSDSDKKRSRNASSVSFVLPEDHVDKPYSPMESSRRKQRNQRPEIYITDHLGRVQHVDNVAPANVGEFKTQTAIRVIEAERKGTRVFNSSFKKLLNGKNKASNVNDTNNGESRDSAADSAILHSTFVHVGSL